jgi:acetolactate synthase I/II/III large subunit
MPREYRVVDHIVERLASIGVDHIFGVDGANIEDFYDAAQMPVKATVPNEIPTVKENPTDVAASA